MRNLIFFSLILLLFIPLSCQKGDEGPNKKRRGESKMEAGIIHVTSDVDFDTKIQESTVPVVVDLWAPWCAPCIMQGKVLEELKAKHGDKVTVIKVNVDEVPEIAQRYQVQAIPTLLFFKDGKMTDMNIGLTPLEGLEKKLGLSE